MYDQISFTVEVASGKGNVKMPFNKQLTFCFNAGVRRVRLEVVIKEDQSNNSVFKWSPSVMKVMF